MAKVSINFIFVCTMMVWITGNPRSKECHREGNWGLKKKLMHVLIFESFNGSVHKF